MRVLTPRDTPPASALLQGTRALPEQTAADRLLEKLSGELETLKSDPAELDAVKARLTPREPLTQSLRARLKDKDERIADHIKFHAEHLA